jgi:hypothetical protein
MKAGLGARVKSGIHLRQSYGGQGGVLKSTTLARW